MAWREKVPAAKIDNPNLAPRVSTMERGKWTTTSCPLMSTGASDFHTQAVVFVPLPQIQIKNAAKQKSNPRDQIKQFLHLTC